MLKLYDSVVTLKYNTGHLEWNGQVKLSAQYHHSEFDIYPIYGV